ncbi:hypothetical protein EUX98_g7985 [Antrodiella citrinella]|uniref:Protein kinase domain-containing protein n=1 Tax=Antrodiella citrinella TaxID=2447956 RepID=A0A4S4MEU3_9APHY|nr:hypothetical protein EUX98_g7985 [Antrodiella citrinella]
MFPAATIIKGVKLTEKEKMGGGGYANVYLGRESYKHVAIKRLHLYEKASDEIKRQTRQSFYRESMLWKHLSHKHVLPFLGVSEDVFPRTVCIILPWMSHGSIRDYIPRCQKEGRLSGSAFGRAVVKWFHQTAQGLAYLHEQKIIHGDLHAGNILIDTDHNARLTDFGVAIIAEANASEGSESIYGALRWQAPELFDPEEFGLPDDSVRSGAASDVYALGLTGIELYTGKIPFPEISDPIMVQRRVIKGVRPNRPVLPDGPISDDIWDLLCWTWAHNASDRPLASQVATELGDIRLSSHTAGLSLHTPQVPEIASEPAAAEAIERIRSPSPTAAFTELMNTTLQSPADRQRFFLKAIKEGENLMKLNPAYFNQAAQIFHKALLAYHNPPELLMIYEGMLQPPVLQLVKNMYQARTQ